MEGPLETLVLTQLVTVVQAQATLAEHVGLLQLAAPSWHSETAVVDELTFPQGPPTLGQR